MDRHPLLRPNETTIEALERQHVQIKQLRTALRELAEQIEKSSLVTYSLGARARRAADPLADFADHPEMEKDVLLILPLAEGEHG